MNDSGVLDRLDSIPAAMRGTRAWGVVTVGRDGNRRATTAWQKWKYLKATDPNTWGTFEQAVNACAERGSGLAYVPCGGVVCIDLDHIWPSPSPRWKLPVSPAQVLQSFNGYREVSRSGTGAHQYVFGRKPGKRKLAGGVEMFEYGNGNGWIDVTGNVIDGHEQLLPEQDALEALYALMVAGERSERTVQGISLAHDLAVLQRLGRDDKGIALFDGLAGHPFATESAADLSLMNRLGRDTGGDEAQMVALFTASARGLKARERERSNYDNHVARTLARTMLDFDSKLALRSNSALRSPPSFEELPDGVCSAGFSKEVMLGLYGSPEVPDIWALPEFQRNHASTARVARVVQRIASVNHFVGRLRFTADRTTVAELAVVPEQTARYALKSMERRGLISRNGGGEWTGKGRNAPLVYHWTGPRLAGRAV